MAGFFWREHFEDLQIPPILKVVLGSILGSVLGASLGFFDFLNHFMIIFGAGAKIVDWSSFSLAQRRIASREREKVILIWGQTGCWNLQFFKITIFFMFVTAYPRGSVNYITFLGQSRFAPSKKILPLIRRYVCNKTLSYKKTPLFPTPDNVGWFFWKARKLH